MADADALRLQRDQMRQRALSPLKVAQSVFQKWAGSNMAAMDSMCAADLVQHVERAIVAERANSSSALPAKEE